MKKSLKIILNNLHDETQKKGEFLYLTANESMISSLASKYQKNFLNNRYVLGSARERKGKDFYFYGDNFLVQGFPEFDKLESLAKKVCKKMFKCKYVDFSPLSGMHAMTSVIGSLSDPGDLILSLSCEHGGHFATKFLIKRLGRESVFLPYNEKEFEIDFEKLKKIKDKREIKMVYLDIMCPLRPFNLKKIKEILPKSILVYDGSHALGLIAGGQFQDPLSEGADILSGNTHKTLPGPQKGMIMFNDKKFEEKLLSVSSVFTSSRHTNSSISLFITLLEMEKFGKEYAGQIIKNSRVLAEEIHKSGLDLLAYQEIKPTAHQVFICLEKIKQASDLIKAGVVVNTVSVFGKNFIRLGTQQVTRLGMKEKEMRQIAKIITKVLKEKNITDVREEVCRISKKFNKIGYSFDD